MKPNDPVSEGAAGAIAHLNEDHADALLDMARALGGCPGATAARCLDADTAGLDLVAQVDGSERPVRVSYDEPIEEPAGLRKATVKLAHRAREILGQQAK